MIWLTIYLASAIVVPTIFMAIWSQRSAYDKYEIGDPAQVFGVALFCLLWPIVISVMVFTTFMETRKQYYINTGREILRKHNVDGINQHDRTAMTVIPEGDLKFLLKNYRLKRIQLDGKIVELIRDELMNRNAERHLFK